MNTKIKDIQNVYWNGKKATMYTVWRFEDDSWHHESKGMVFGWFKTDRGIKNQILREEGI